MGTVGTFKGCHYSHIKCVHLWDSLPQPLSLLHLPVSSHWVPHTLVLMCVPCSWPCPPRWFRASCDTVHSKLGFTCGDPGMFGDFSLIHVVASAYGLVMRAQTSGLMGSLTISHLNLHAEHTGTCACSPSLTNTFMIDVLPQRGSLKFEECASMAIAYLVSGSYFRLILSILF